MAVYLLPAAYTCSDGIGTVLFPVFYSDLRVNFFENLPRRPLKNLPPAPTGGRVTDATDDR